MQSTTTPQGRLSSAPMDPARKRQLLHGAAALAISAPLYLVPNHFPILEPRLLPLTWVDEAMPFVPTSIWLYLSEWPMIFGAYWRAREPQNIKRFLLSILVAQVIAMLFFVLYPTTYPRERFPLPEGMDALSRLAFEAQRAADTPLNCFPSLHVTSVLMIAFLFREEQRRLYPLYLGWAIAICVSTLTTKQHYLADVVGGAILALATDAWFRRARRAPAAPSPA